MYNKTPIFIVITSESSLKSTEEVVDQIYTHPTVFTGVWITIIDVFLAHFTWLEWRKRTVGSSSMQVKLLSIDNYSLKCLIMTND